MASKLRAFGPLLCWQNESDDDGPCLVGLGRGVNEAARVQSPGHSACHSALSRGRQGVSLPSREMHRVDPHGWIGIWLCLFPLAPPWAGESQCPSL